MFITALPLCGGCLPDVPAIAAPPFDEPRLAGNLSPEFEVAGELESWVVFDPMRAEPTWIDRATRRVRRLRAGRIEDVQDRAISGLPGDGDDTLGLRVFDDDSFAVAWGGRLHLYPVGAEAIDEDLAVIEMAFDGRSIDDLWYAAWFLDERGYRLCHRTVSATRCDVAINNAGGYSSKIAVASTGVVYVNDRNRGFFRYADGQMTQIENDIIVDRFRRTRDVVFTFTNRGVYAIEGRSWRRVTPITAYPYDIVGAADDYYRLWRLSATVQVDPNCRAGFLSSCAHRDQYRGAVVERVRAGRVTQVGHEICDAAHEEVCIRTVRALGLDGDVPVVIGAPLRRVVP